MSSSYTKKQRLQEKKDQYKRPEKIAQACEALRQFVDNLNKAPAVALRGGVFQAMDRNQVFICKVDGWEFGYRLIDHGPFVERRCFIKSSQHLDEIPAREKDRVMYAAMEAFLDNGQGEVNIEPISPFAVLLTQKFLPLFWMEKNPNIVVPGKPH